LRQAEQFFSGPGIIITGFSGGNSMRRTIFSGVISEPFQRLTRILPCERMRNTKDKYNRNFQAGP